MKQTTLCYPIKDGKVLLAMKKRGFGAGKWNGAGGKLKSGENPLDACQREVKEEIGIGLPEVEERGIIEFRFPERPEWDQDCHIFVATAISGEPSETEEMKPGWFSFDGLPYADMWDDDPHWLLGVLRGGRVNMRFYFDATSNLLRFENL